MTWRPAGDIRNATSPATSSGPPARPAKVSASSRSRRPGVIDVPKNSVSWVYPGATNIAVMPRGPPCAGKVAHPGRQGRLGRAVRTSAACGGDRAKGDDRCSVGDGVAECLDGEDGGQCVHPPRRVPGLADTRETGLVGRAGDSAGHERHAGDRAAGDRVREAAGAGGCREVGIDQQGRGDVGKSPRRLLEGGAPTAGEDERLRPAREPAGDRAPYPGAGAGDDKDVVGVGHGHGISLALK